MLALTPELGKRPLTTGRLKLTVPNAKFLPEATGVAVELTLDNSLTPLQRRLKLLRGEVLQVIL